MKCRLNSGQRVYSSQYLCLKRTKISSQYLAFHLKKTRKRRINLIQTKEKEGDSKLQSRDKQRIKKNNRESKQNQNQFFEKINKIDKPLARLTEIKMRKD